MFPVSRLLSFPRGPINSILYSILPSSSTTLTPKVVRVLAPSPLQAQEVLTKYAVKSKNTISSSATQIFYIHDKEKTLCVKRWLPCQNLLYTTIDNTMCSAYTFNGLNFNRLFAPDVYLGIAPIEVYRNTVCLGSLLEQPSLDEIQRGVEYALVMNKLPGKSRLDYQLRPNLYGNSRGMEFLANWVAEMHNRIKHHHPEMQGPSGIGSTETIKEKWHLNRKLFKKCLKSLPALSKEDLADYQNIELIMNKAHRYCANKRYFDQRYQDQHIKRCHGDLKTTNLWIRSNSASSELLALDCVDFKPEFCYIDTLSDVAMLAIDIEVQIALHTQKWPISQPIQELSYNFLCKYLDGTHEEANMLVWSLLEYYMTEKAIICAYMSILYDGKPELGTQYLKVAHTHAEKLSKLLF